MQLFGLFEFPVCRMKRLFRLRLCFRKEPRGLSRPRSASMVRAFNAAIRFGRPMGHAEQKARANGWPPQRHLKGITPSKAQNGAVQRSPPLKASAYYPLLNRSFPAIASAMLSCISCNNRCIFRTCSNGAKPAYRAGLSGILSQNFKWAGPLDRPFFCRESSQMLAGACTPAQLVRLQQCFSQFAPGRTHRCYAAAA